MKGSLFALFLILVLIHTICGCGDVKEVPEEKDWWETATFYQIYPRSYKDSNGDGIGDLKGITEKLPYLKELGVAATWLSPIFKSPMADFGYDISDFYDIQPEYGTMEDFENLLNIAKQLGIKIVLDFVPNHSSDENDWFVKSANRVQGFEDYYVWHPGYPDPNNETNRLPPSNWLSVFRYSAWEWNDVRQEFYLHQFAKKQPDLNYRNPAVVEQMKSVLRFWLNKGVSGFRVDAVPHLFEVNPATNGRYPDEPKSGNTNDPDDFSYLNHIYTQNLPETIDMVYQWREVLDNHRKEHGGDTRVMLTEAYADINILMKYYGDGTRPGSHIPFNFYFIMKLNNDSNAYDFKENIDIWMNNLPSGRTANWVIGNHDNNRVASRFGTDRIDLFNMILNTLPGVSITYNGEEIGMTDVFISWHDTVDPQACNSDPEHYAKLSRDPERTPFQWDTTTSAGFSTNPKTWLPVSPNYEDVNVQKQRTDDRSHLKVYLELLKLRKTNTLRSGDLVTRALNNNVLAILRQLTGKETFITVANIGTSTESVDLSVFAHLPSQLQYYIVGVDSAHRAGESVATKTVILAPREAAVLRAPPQQRYYDYQVILQ